MRHDRTTMNREHSVVNENRASGNRIGRRKWATPLGYAGLIAVVAILPLLITTSYWLHVLILYMIYAIVATSFRTISISGQLPLAHATFMGIGAYIAGMTSKLLGWPPWMSMPAGALVAAAIGTLTAYPLARLRSLYYALGSLFLGMALVYVIMAPERWTGGRPGLAGIPVLFGGSKIPIYYFCLFLTALCLFALHRFEYSRIGTSLRAIAQSHSVASSVGINEVFYRVFAVGVGCFFAGLSGSVYAHYNGVLSYTSFNLMATLWIVIYVLVGGVGRFSGPIVGSALLFIVPEVFRDLRDYVPYLSAGILLVVVYLMPQGLVTLPGLVGSWFIQRWQKQPKSSVGM